MLRKENDNIVNKENNNINSTYCKTQHKLIICEKPSVGADFAKVLGSFSRENGYLENEEWIITWSVGHLVTLSYPEVYDENLKKWTLNTLPFLP